MSEERLRLEANLISRLDRMPMNREVRLLVGLLSLCWVMEAFDIGMIGQVLLVLKQLWDLDPSMIGLLGSCSTVGVVIGTASAGFLTDRYGRKRVLLWGVFIFTFFTLIGSLFAHIGWIVAMRFIAGLGAGAVFPLPYLMISEIAPSRSGYGDRRPPSAVWKLPPRNPRRRSHDDQLYDHHRRRGRTAAAG